MNDLNKSFKEEVICETNFPELKLLRRGKVRDIYDLEDKLLIVATDRISAFDVILSEGIPFKGKVLTQISKFWFEQIKDIIENHIVSFNVEDYPPQCQKYKKVLNGRSMLVKKTEVLPVECVVRGYLSGSAFEEYKKTGKTVAGIDVGEGLMESSKLRTPIFTPSTKAESGHDENISFDEMRNIVGEKTAEEIRKYSIAIYERAVKIADERGIIIADTKFEFGKRDGKMILVDEVLTPDSSRFWPKDEYTPGRPQKSFDKQFVRDYLKSTGWNKVPPPPPLPEDIIIKTSNKYLDALQKLTGSNIL
ncbi:MAG: phosphoribosylaminoimidazolesuccinocarboxamide synthase [Candidatus Schekmanbacteria bacterium]|nr:MAG: phosphoribosylaminoimidazolesuccinocarboxamide synthase [Candidatus Schekmanbacteria bacterium]